MLNFESSSDFQLNVWGLKIIPFSDVPPNDPELVNSFFVGRNDEYERALVSLGRGENLLIRGTWGIGKTAFILSTLYRVQQELSCREQAVFVCPTYIQEFQGGTVPEFYNIIAYALEKSRGNLIKRLWKKIKPDELGIQFLPALQMTWYTEASESDVFRKISLLFDLHHRDGKRPIIAFDDLDKDDSRQGTINKMLSNSLNILRNTKCGFIVTGRAITQLDDIEITQLGVVNEIIQLNPLDKNELFKAAIHQLNIARIVESESIYPFTDDVLSEIAEKSYGIPRIFYRLCRKTLDIAARKRYEVIDNSAFRVCYAQLQDDISVQIPPEFKQILYYALQRDGFLVSSPDESLEDVLSQVGASTVFELLPYLDKLLQKDIMIRTSSDEGIRYRVAPGAEKAADEGGDSVK